MCVCMGVCVRVHMCVYMHVCACVYKVMYFIIYLIYFISQQARNNKVEAQLTAQQLLREESNCARIMNYKEVSIPYTWKFSRHVYFTVKHETRIFAVKILRMKTKSFCVFCALLQGYVRKMYATNLNEIDKTLYHASSIS